MDPGGRRANLSIFFCSPRSNTTPEICSNRHSAVSQWQNPNTRTENDHLIPCLRKMVGARQGGGENDGTTSISRRHHYRSKRFFHKRSFGSVEMDRWVRGRLSIKRNSFPYRPAGS